MDKSRDVRRGASRFLRQIKQSGHKLFFGWSDSGGGGGCNDGGFLSLEKSKKERTKKLSAVNRVSPSYEDNYEMGRHVSDKEEDFPSQTASISGNGTCQRFKLPRKFFDDSNGVDHASVPKKLRSAIKKRNGESISPSFPDSKNLNHATGGFETPERVGVKKLKMNIKHGGSNWSCKRSECGPITKDEEEVVETLFALAGMFPDNEANSKSKLDNASLDASPSALPEDKESQPLLEDSMARKEDMNSVCLLKTNESADHASTLGRSPEESAIVNSLNEQSVGKQPNLSSSKKFPGEFAFSAAQANQKTISAKNEEPKPSISPVNLHVLPELYQDIGKLKQPLKLETSQDRKPEIGLGQTTAIRNQMDHPHTISESKRSGPGLQPALSSTVFSGPSLQSSATKFPAWLDTALCGTMSGSSSAKVSINADRKTWKRCAAHVYISSLIQGLQMPKNKDRLYLHPEQELGSNEILKQDMVMAINNFGSISNGPSGVTCNSVGKNPSEFRNGVLERQRLHQDQQLVPTASRVYTSQNQSFNFLSLSVGGGATEATSSSNGGEKGVEQLAQLQVPYLHSHMQHPTLMPFPLARTRHISSTIQQAHLQFPSFLSTSLAGTRQSATTTALTKQQQQEQLHQQQQLWAAYRTAEYSKAMNQVPCWQNGRHVSPTLTPCPQPIIPPAVSSLGAIGSKYTQISQHQQQQLVNATSSMPHARVKRQDRHLSSVHEETGSGFLAAGALPLQLLCNERL